MACSRSHSPGAKLGYRPRPGYSSSHVEGEQDPGTESTEEAQKEGGPAITWGRTRSQWVVLTEG